MRREASLRQLRALVQRALQQLGWQRPVRRGRKPRYSEGLIITLALYMQQENLSIREVLSRAGAELGEPMPVPSTLVHRLHRLEPALMERVVEVLGAWAVQQQGRGGEGGGMGLCAMDGTGFGYDDVLGLSYKRGKEVRRVRAHVRVVVLMALKDGRGCGAVLGVAGGGAYASEVKLAEGMLGRKKGGAVGLGLVLADGCYDAVKVLRGVQEAGGRALVKLKGGRTGRRVRDPLRQEVAARWKQEGKLYSRRNAVEALFSQVKRKMGSVLRVRSERVAMVLALARFACWNACLLLAASDDGILFVLVFLLPRHP